MKHKNRPINKEFEIKLKEEIFQLKKSQRKEINLRLLEFATWTFLFCMIVSFYFMQFIKGAPLSYILQDSPFLYLGILLYIFILFYYLTFAQFPMESLRNSFQQKREEDLKQEELRSVRKKESQEKEIVSFIKEELISQQQEKEIYSVEKPDILLQNLINDSNQLSKKIHKRAISYLLAGITTAIIGIIFFYFQIWKFFEMKDITDIISQTISRVGFLVFVESFAIFFLKQYRTSMEEFKYFDEIKRNREETLLILRIAQQQKKNLDFFKLIESYQLHKSVGKLKDNETTESIESKKAERNKFEALIKELNRMLTNYKK